MIPYGKQDITQDDIDEVSKVLKSDFLTQGPCVPKFEEEVSKYCGAKHAVAVSSATSALHLACLTLGLGKDDWLWTSPVTFVASANCGVYCGAKVDFVDIDPRTFNLCPKALKKKLVQAKESGKLPKVVIPVHFAGQPCDLQAIKSLSKRYGFKIRAVGFNPTASKTAGINSDRIIMSSMFLSGGLAGLAGVFYVIGTAPYRYVSGFEGTLGFDGIAVALIAQNSPIAIAFAAIFFGFLTEGKNSLDRTTDIPPDILFALQAFVIIFIAAPAISKWVIDRLKILKKGNEDAPTLEEENVNE
ncbi:aminotransferase class I/II-fold pyridoxal phosphate-dependent enzyme [archaeon]|nr:aminotransferase class I/II-fold pyridoxal phosphate-dependent enzyme [archaeon]NDB55286.1 aminotransferase class I/II-fold pyridoxal phosphate-dependent enzyme [archaeon]NDB79142.1 aminotransferase class I/II-fold pyridoxal phosphate-dependent enzyme [archaeon]